MLRRLRLLASQRGAVNRATIDAPVAATSSGARACRAIGSGCPVAVGHMAAGSCDRVGPSVRMPSLWARRPAWYCSTFVFNSFLDLRSPEIPLYF
jgi:hypothetical protein